VSTWLPFGIINTASGFFQKTSLVSCGLAKHNFDSRAQRNDKPINAFFKLFSDVYFKFVVH
jgi:hypothetical protein